MSNHYPVFATVIVTYYCCSITATATIITTNSMASYCQQHQIITITIIIVYIKVFWFLKFLTYLSKQWKLKMMNWNLSFSIILRICSIIHPNKEKKKWRRANRWLCTRSWKINDHFINITTYSPIKWILSIKPHPSLDYMSKLLNRFKVFKRNINISLSIFYEVVKKKKPSELA